MRVAIASCEVYDSSALVKAIRSTLADIEFKVPQGKTVLLKPNLLMAAPPERHITTHPAFVDAVCRIFKGNRIIIADSSGGIGRNETMLAFERSGIADVAKKHKAKVMCFEASKPQRILINNPLVREIVLPELLFEADLVVNLPKLKTHSLCTMTGGVKNLFGCVPGALKSRYHALACTNAEFSGLLLDIYSEIKPELNIIDAVVSMEGNGPSAGDLINTRFIAASKNALALDYVLSRVTGLGDVATVDLAEKRRLLDYSNVKIVGQEPSFRFKLPAAISNTPFRKVAGTFLGINEIKPRVKKGRCVRCGSCKSICPKKAIELAPYPLFDRKLCISCYCCQEACQEGAIYIRPSLPKRILFSVARAARKIIRM